MRWCSRKWSSGGGRLALTVAVMAAAWPAGAQNGLQPQVSAFRADSALVLVPVTVVDRRGAVVNGLRSDAFTLTEDGVRERIHSFSQEDAPVSLGVVLDLSGSMRGVLGSAKESLAALMKDANPADEAFLNAVSERPRAYSGFTTDFGGMLSRVAFENAGGNTALVDTIYDSLNELRSGVHARKALLVISDGMDNHSRHSKRELLARAVEADAQIYTIAVRNPATRYAKPMQVTEEKRGLLFLDELAARTGGMSFTVLGSQEISEAAAGIGEALRNQYTIGYVPDARGGSGKWHRIKITVAGSGMKAYARSGYRADR
jgi:Ca-activated chloride channel family protein